MNSSFFSSLFDFQFNEFVTPKIIKIIFWIIIIMGAIWTLVMLVMGFMSMGESVIGGLVQIILAPVIGLLMVTFGRVYLEVIMIFFRISNKIDLIVGDGCSKTPEAATPPPAPPAQPAAPDAQ